MTQIFKAMNGLGVGLLIAGSGAVVVAQGIFNPTAATAERYIGGGLLLTVAVLIVHWSRQAGRDARHTLEAALDKTQQTLDQTMSILETERDSWQSEREAMRNERAALAAELTDTRVLLAEERSLRISLERAGIIDRRDNGENPRTTSRRS